MLITANMRRALPLVMLSVLSGPVYPAGADREQRIHQLEEKLMAPCCYQSTLADHRSDTATQMKLEIAAWVAAGKSDQEIIESYKSRYGARILVEPEGASGLWLTTVPVLALLLGLIAVSWLIRRWSTRGAGSACEPN